MIPFGEHGAFVKARNADIQRDVASAARKSQSTHGAHTVDPASERQWRALCSVSAHLGRSNAGQLRARARGLVKRLLLVRARGQMHDLPGHESSLRACGCDVGGPL